MSDEEVSPNQAVAQSASPVQTPPKEPDGPPKTPYGLAVFLVPVVGTYSWFFKTWDESEFPETFTNPLYWIFLFILFLLAGLLIILMRKSSRERVPKLPAPTRRGWLDGAIIASIFLISIGTLVTAIFVSRETKPAGDKFGVVLFTFSGDNTITQNAAASFQQSIVRKLEKEYGKQIICLSRERKIKGENFIERLAYARKWAARRVGCHLAVWADLEMDDDGQHYIGTAHYLKVSPFGDELESNPDSLGVFSNLGEFSDSSKSTPVGFAKSVGNEQVERAVDLVKLCWGLASYRKGDYDTAFQVLPNGFETSEFFAGEAAETKANQMVEPGQLFEDAEAHYQKAIKLNGYEGRQTPTFHVVDDKHDLAAALYYSRLEAAYNDELISGRGKDLKQKAASAISAVTEAAQIYEELHKWELYAESLISEAKCWVDLSVIDNASAVSADVNRAERLLEKAISYLKPNSNEYANAEKELGRIHTIEMQYAKAIEEEKLAAAVFLK
jgi:tetratricopeptide (TPR) repeat protein